MQKVWRLCLCLAALFWLLGLSRGVQAHALLLAAEPPENGILAQSPGAIQLWFTEPVEPNFTEIVLRAADGSVQQTGKPNRDLSDPAYVSVSLPALREGVYSVTWKVLSQLDGHITNGTYAFAVGSGDPTALSSSSTASANLPEVLARWLMASGLALVLGSLTFPLLVWRAPLPPADNRSWQRMQWLGCGLLLLAALGGLWAQSSQLNGEKALQPAALGQLLLATRWGWLWLLRLAAIAWLAINLQHRLGKVLVGLAALGFLLAHSFSTHAASVGILWLGVTTSVLHIAAVSVWLGGLVGLLYQLPRLRALPLSDRWEMLAVAIGRFSPLGLAAVGLLSLSGSLTAWQTVGGLAALQGSSYGNALLLKLGVVLVIVLVAAYNLLVIKPGIARRRAQPQQSRPDLVNALRQAVFVESGLGLGILGLAALVASLPFPNVQPRQMRFQAAAEDLQLQLQIIPGQVGFNQYIITAKNADGSPLLTAKDVSLQFTPISVNLPPSTLILQPQPQQPGQYLARGANLSQPDAWQVQATVRREQQFDAFANFDVALVANASASAASSNAWRSASALAALAVGLLLCTWQAQPRQRWHWLAGLPASALLLGVGALLASGWGQPPPIPVSPTQLVNPIPPNQFSVVQGQQLYQANCLVCHGVTGQGDGPAGLALNPRPANLQQHSQPGVHADGELFDWIRNGFPTNPVMPAFKERLTDEEVWHLVNYMRTTFGGQSR